MGSPASKPNMVVTESAPGTIQCAPKPPVEHGLAHVQRQQHEMVQTSEKTAGKERKTVTFNLEDRTEHEVTPYSEIYEISPRDSVLRALSPTSVSDDGMSSSDQDDQSGIGEKVRSIDKQAIRSSRGYLLVFSESKCS